MTQPTYAPMAFPVPNETFSDGMELRDWFAGQVITAIGGPPGEYRTHPSVLANYAYRIADAMMEARGQ